MILSGADIPSSAAFSQTSVDDRVLTLENRHAYIAHLFNQFNHELDVELIEIRHHLTTGLSG